MAPDAIVAGFFFLCVKGAEDPAGDGGSRRRLRARRRSGNISKQIGSKARDLRTRYDAFPIFKNSYPNGQESRVSRLVSVIFQAITVGAHS